LKHVTSIFNVIIQEQMTSRIQQFTDNLSQNIMRAPGVIQKRIDRVNLDTTKSYVRVRSVGGKEVKEYVGTFVRVYRMGSGDGMTVHIEFNDNGRITRVDEEMWGSLSGAELSYFLESGPR
jgi:hypothetical protein